MSVPENTSSEAVTEEGTVETDPVDNDGTDNNVIPVTEPACGLDFFAACVSLTLPSFLLARGRGPSKT